LVRQFIIDSVPVDQRGPAKCQKETTEQQIGGAIQAFLTQSFERQHRVMAVRDTDEIVAVNRWFKTTRDQLVRDLAAYLARRDSLTAASVEPPRGTKS